MQYDRPVGKDSVFSLESFPEPRESQAAKSRVRPAEAVELLMDKKQELKPGAYASRRPRGYSASSMDCHPCQSDFRLFQRSDMRHVFCFRTE